MDLNAIKVRFLDDVEKHHTRFIKDDGMYRHIRFQRPGTSIYYFDLITWPGNLCCTGDTGTYVFSRVEDMFTFFRRKALEINPGYWSEKCFSQSIFGNGIRQFSKDVFESAITSEFKYYIEHKREYVDLTDREEIKKFGTEMRAVWDDIKGSIFGAENEYEAMDSVYKYDGNGEEWLFQDFWETTITEYTHHFLWCLYAIVWGISQYDEVKGYKQNP